MTKQILTFFSVFLLCACATTGVKQANYRPLRTVDFFAEGKTQAAFKVTGTMDTLQMDGIITAKKIADRVDVTLLAGGLYRVLYVTVSPEKVEYLYLFKDVDNAVVRGRITQLLDLLFMPPGTQVSTHTKKGETAVTYKGPRAKEVFNYDTASDYPVTARTLTTLNNADLVYGDYMPVSADGETQVPHELVYKDGKIILDMQLISLR